MFGRRKTSAGISVRTRGADRSSRLARFDHAVETEGEQVRPQRALLNRVISSET